MVLGESCGVEGLGQLRTMLEVSGGAGELQGRGVWGKEVNRGQLQVSHGAPCPPFHGSRLPLTPATSHSPSTAPHFIMLASAHYPGCSQLQGPHQP